jgi:hypothetical protein
MSFPPDPLPNSPVLSSSTSLSESDDPDPPNSESAPNFFLHSFTGRHNFIASSEDSSHIQWGDPILPREDHSAVVECDLTARWNDSDSSSKSTVQQKDCFSSPQTSSIACDYMHQKPIVFLIPSIPPEVNRYHAHGCGHNLRMTLTKIGGNQEVMRNAGDLQIRGN